MMKYAFSLFVIFTVLGRPAHAAGQLPPECRLFSAHRAEAGVAYTPGVDVRGRAVAPADINAAPADLGRQTMVIPLSIDMAERIDTLAGVKLEATQGFLEITPDGRVMFNGQDLTPQAYAVCGHEPPELGDMPGTEQAPAAVDSAPDMP